MTEEEAIYRTKGKMAIAKLGTTHFWTDTQDAVYAVSVPTSFVLANLTIGHLVT